MRGGYIVCYIAVLIVYREADVCIIKQIDYHIISMLTSVLILVLTLLLPGLQSLSQSIDMYNSDISEFGTR